MHYRRYAYNYDSADLLAMPGVPWQAICRSKMCVKTFFFATATFLLGMVFLISMRMSLRDQRVTVDDYDLLPSLDGWKVQALCQGPPLDVLFFVHTASEHTSRRQFLRDTLGDPMVSEQLNSAMVFFVGQSKNLTVRRAIQEEARSVGDVVVFPFVDTYRNLTYKFVYGLKWANDNCRESVRFVVKIDDDALVNVFLLADYLKNVTGNAADTSIHCLAWMRTPVVRKRGSKWYVTRQEYAARTYPTYCGGLGFILPVRTLPMLFNASRQASFLWIDDVYSTGILAKVAGVGHVQLRHYYDLFPNETAPIVRPKAMFTHMGTASIIEHRYRLWDDIMQMHNASTRTEGSGG
uniref:Hexosyltransferase n=1 Tax=Rhipicephalus appendiculatus TaxID=34631 RepID=A0A131Z034_RHIAP